MNDLNFPSLTMSEVGKEISQLVTCLENAIPGFENGGPVLVEEHAAGGQFDLQAPTLVETKTIDGIVQPQGAIPGFENGGPVLVEEHAAGGQSDLQAPTSVETRTTDRIVQPQQAIPGFENGGPVLVEEHAAGSQSDLQAPTLVETRTTDRIVQPQRAIPGFEKDGPVLVEEHASGGQSDLQASTSVETKTTDGIVQPQGVITALVYDDPVLLQQDTDAGGQFVFQAPTSVKATITRRIVQPQQAIPGFEKDGPVLVEEHAPGGQSDLQASTSVETKTTDGIVQPQGEIPVFVNDDPILIQQVTVSGDQTPTSVKASIVKGIFQLQQVPTSNENVILIKRKVKFNEEFLKIIENVTTKQSMDLVLTEVMNATEEDPVLIIEYTGAAQYSAAANTDENFFAVHAGLATSGVPYTFTEELFKRDLYNAIAAGINDVKVPNSYIIFKCRNQTIFAALIENFVEMSLQEWFKTLRIQTGIPLAKRFSSNGNTVFNITRTGRPNHIW